jgi:methylenetetrahydrofolate reductase (NADPH)
MTVTSIPPSFFHSQNVQDAKKHGCRNVLALRGDPPQGQEEWSAVEGGFVHGVDLVRHIHREYDDYFDIAVAGFPQQALLPLEERQQEYQWLKEKIDEGVSFIFTQMFYDVEVFIQWVREVRAAGITIPIVPGIAPIQTWNGFQRATSLAQTKIPQSFLDALEPHKNNDEKVREIGTKLVADMCRRILKEDIGIRGLHFYTMNLEKGTKMLLEELNLVPRVETIKPLPWRQVHILYLSIYLDYRININSIESYAQQTARNHPSHLLGKPYQVLHLAHRELGRVPQRPLW